MFFVNIYTLVCHCHAFFSIVCCRLLQVNDQEKFLQLYCQILSYGIGRHFPIEILVSFYSADAHILMSNK